MKEPEKKKCSSYVIKIIPLPRLYQNEKKKKGFNLKNPVIPSISE